MINRRLFSTFCASIPFTGFLKSGNSDLTVYVAIEYYDHNHELRSDYWLCLKTKENALRNLKDVQSHVPEYKWILKMFNINYRDIFRTQYTVYKNDQPIYSVNIPHSLYFMDMTDEMVSYEIENNYRLFVDAFNGGRAAWQF